MIHQFKLATMLLQLEGVATTQALEVVLGPFAQVGKKVGAVVNLVLAAGSAANPSKVQCDGAFSIAPLDAGMLGAVEELREGK